MSRLPLHGVRVLECASVIAGPYCSYMLTLLGAETIKIERPSQGDWMRSQGGDAALVAAGMGSTFLSCNAGKRSVALNLKDPRGVKIAREIAAGVDVMIENWRPGTAARLGVGFEAIRAVNPRIVYCSISGFGQDGPLSPRPAYDHVIQAVSGIMSVTGTPETAPSRTGPPLVDYMTGLSAAVAILAALRERDRTGEAQSIDVGMLDCAVAGMGSILSAHVNGGVPAAPVGNAAASGAPSSGLFPTKHLAAHRRRQHRGAVRGAVRRAGPARAFQRSAFLRARHPQAEPGCAARDHRGVPGRAPGDRMGRQAGRGGCPGRRGALGARAVGRGAGLGARSVPPPRAAGTGPRGRAADCRLQAQRTTGSRPSRRRRCSRPTTTVF